MSGALDTKPGAMWMDRVFFLFLYFVGGGEERECKRVAMLSAGVWTEGMAYSHACHGFFFLFFLRFV